MSLEDFLASVIYDTSTLSAEDAAGFEQACDNIFAEAYLGSPVAAGMFERLVSSGRTLTVAYTPGELSWDEAGSTASNEIVRFDFRKVESIVFIDDDGTLFDATARRMLIHETVHAIEGWYDNPPNGTGLPTDPNFDFSGPVVDRTNVIEDQLGSENKRTSYWGTFSKNSPEDYDSKENGYTNGSHIDIAFTNIDGQDFPF